MTSDTTSTTATATESTPTVPEFLEAGFSHDEIDRLQALRDCARCFPTIEFFGSHEWKRLLFLR